MGIDYTERDDARLGAYVARVAALSPADWGRLDAIGARLADGAPMFRWRRAALDASAVGLSRLLSEAPATAAAFVGRLAFDTSLWASITWWRLTDGDPCAEVTAADRPELAEVPATEALHERQRRYGTALRDAIGRQPGRRRAVEYGQAAARCLEYGFHALILRPVLPAQAFTRVYAVVEPVIPLASLDEQQYFPVRGVAT